MTLRQMLFFAQNIMNYCAENGFFMDKRKECLNGMFLCLNGVDEFLFHWYNICAFSIHEYNNHYPIK